MAERRLICDWVYHPNFKGRGIVQCRRCREFDSYPLVGYKPEPPVRECEGSDEALFAAKALAAAVSRSESKAAPAREDNQ